ncbi:MAG TPA: O-acetyl-ADP-ribose deacetylase [Clostridiaceae bacterium]|nr:O-acetyl-ADP-ribose deacetylase [Clostridiaceae bacterium]
MPLEIIRNDITKVHADAIVNAANPSLLGGGGVDGAIHRAAGPELLEECRTLGGCQVGQAKITKGYKLPAKYVIHTVGPIWQGGNHNEEALLAACYRNSLNLAKIYNLESIAFPLISTGAYGYPKDKALRTAISVIGDFLLNNNEMLVFLVIYDKASLIISEKLFKSIKKYIDDKYIKDHFIERRSRVEEEQPDIVKYIDNRMMAPAEVFETAKKRKRSLNDVINNMDETFSQMLLRLIDEKGMTDTEVYKRANVDRKLFSKIRNNIYYKPSKRTAIAFAIALKLNLDETKDLLLKAGYALSHSSKFDIIIEYFIEEGNYNIFEINEALFTFDQDLLGV